MIVRKILFNSHGDERGQLVAVEELSDIPFEIKRVYYMYNTKEAVVRGKHAHKDLEQVLICVHGSCKIKLDDGSEKQTVLLNCANEGLYVAHHIWREMYDFSKDAVLMVLASKVYDEKDYIRNYDEFLEYIEREQE